MKNRVLIALALALIVAGAFFAGTMCPLAKANAQANIQKSVADTTWDTSITKQIAVMNDALKANLALMNGEEPKDVSRKPMYELVEAYRAGVKSADGVKGLTSKALNSYHLNKATAKSAAQVSQAADEAQIELSLIQIQQNQRIIELLEEVAKKK